jgi:hypothetical protein
LEFRHERSEREYKEKNFSLDESHTTLSSNQTSRVLTTLRKLQLKIEEKDGEREQRMEIVLGNLNETFATFNLK